MAVRPPQQDADDEPESLAFGIAALAPRLEEATLSFPATDEEVVAALGDPEVPCDASGNTLRLSRALEELHAREFDSRRELLELLHPVFERKRRESSGLLGKLRSLWPF